MNYLSELRSAVRRIHGFEADHIASVHVTGRLKGGPTWDGVVEVFSLRGHPRAARCYAWGHQKRRGLRYVAVLGLPPVDSAEKAVSAAGEARPAG